MIGVVLSGALADGTSGLMAIKAGGGTTVVQEPSDAWFDSMALSAIAHVQIDYRLPAAKIGALLVALSGTHGRAPTRFAATAGPALQMDGLSRPPSRRIQSPR